MSEIQDVVAALKEAVEAHEKRVILGVRNREGSEKHRLLAFSRTMHVFGVGSTIEKYSCHLPMGSVRTAPKQITCIRHGFAGHSAFAVAL